VKLPLSALVLIVLAAAAPSASPPVVPGISVLLEDSLGLVQGKRVALLTNQTGVDEHGVSDIDRLARAPGVNLVALASPEHGIRGTVDRQFVASGIDSSTGLPVYSLYGATVLAPPDSLLARIDVLVIDLQDVGTRTWTYVASVVAAMRAAGAQTGGHVQVVVLDRPNPITGTRAQGPILDSALPTRPYALYPMPLRHGLTMGELALFYNDVLGLHADLHVIPVRGWRRGMWFQETGLPWVRPSPNLPDLTSVLLYPAIVPFEGTNVSVGRGTDRAFQQIGAPWLDATRVLARLTTLHVKGVAFSETSFTPVAPTDGKYAGKVVRGISVAVTDRDQVDVGRLADALLWAIARANGDSLHLDTLAVDLRLGSGALRRALVSGSVNGVPTNPNRAAADEAHRAHEFALRTRRYWLYH
jgi:uncharacterized protein YbbC (DUF1343 family)